MVDDSPGRQLTAARSRSLRVRARSARRSLFPVLALTLPPAWACGQILEVDYGPPAAIGQKMVFDEESRSMLLFGGGTLASSRRGYRMSNALWSFNTETEQWYRIENENTPSGRFNFDMALDTKRRTVLVFGGRTSGEGADTWEYNILERRWREITTTPHPPAHHSGSMVYDAARDLFVLFGGYLSGGGFSDETWIFDPNSGTWERRDPTSRPSTRYGQSMVYDPLQNRTVLYGGHWVTRDDSGRESDGFDSSIWYYDVDTDNWVSPDIRRAPAGRYWCNLAYDGTGNRLILFSGNRADGRRFVDLQDDWIFDLQREQWEEVANGPAPPPMPNAALAVDHVRGIAVLHGVTEPTGTTPPQTWLLDLRSLHWRQVSHNN